MKQEIVNQLTARIEKYIYDDCYKDLSIEERNDLFIYAISRMYDKVFGHGVDKGVSDLLNRINTQYANP